MKKINQFPDYSIDETGTIIINNVTNKKIVIGDQIIKGKITGYKYVTLCNELYEWKRIAVHRLVALTYIDNPNNLPEVNHKDHLKYNNNKENLEWVSHQRNIQLSYDNGRKIYKGKDHWLTGKTASPSTKKLMSDSKKGKLHPKFKGFYMVNYKRYDSSIEAYKATNISSKTIARRCKSGKVGSAYYFVSMEPSS